VLKRVVHIEPLDFKRLRIYDPGHSTLFINLFIPKYFKGTALTTKVTDRAMICEDDIKVQNIKEGRENRRA
jgi:hypothetical protein